MRIVKWIVGGYGALLTLAAGGLIGANMAGFAAAAFQFVTDSHSAPETLPTWIHGGWVVGVFLSLLGLVFGKRKHAEKHRQARQLAADADPEPASPDRSTPARPDRPRPTRRVHRHGTLASMALGGLGGALCGAMFGGTLVLLWFSIAYSPFAPRDWVASLKVERQQVGNSLREESVVTTDHPVAWYALGVPIALGAVSGAVFGGVVGVTERR